MSKKKPRAKSPADFTPWNRAFGGTNFAPPREGWARKWPQWLQRGFVNENLLQSDPIELRNDLFSRRREELWMIVDALLSAIEREAKKTLKASSTGKLAEDSSLSEDDFWNEFSVAKFTPREANAIAGLRSVQIIRLYTQAEKTRDGRYLCDPNHNLTYDSFDVGKLLVEMMLAIMAAIRGELWEEFFEFMSKMKDRDRKTAKKLSLLVAEIMKVKAKLEKDNGEKATAKDVWKYFERNAGDIVSVNADRLTYRTGASENKAMAYRRFENLLSTLRKQRAKPA